MMRFLAQRLARSVFVLFGVSAFAFILIDLAPGEYFQEMRLNPQIARETVVALRVEYGLDQPLPVRYARWLRSVSRGELGFSFAYNRPVWALLRARIGNTLILTITALICSWVFAIRLVVWMASRAGRYRYLLSAIDNTILLATLEVLVSLCLVALALRLGWFP